MNIDFERICGPERPLARYFFRCAWAALIPAQLILAVLVNFGLYSSEFVPRTNNTTRGITAHYLDLLVVTPWIETLLMVVLFALLRAGRLSRVMLIWTSALIWAALHSYTRQPGHGVIVFWPFLIFSAIFLKFDAVSRNRAVVYTATVHCLHNILGLLFHWHI